MTVSQVDVFSKFKNVNYSSKINTQKTKTEQNSIIADKTKPKESVNFVSGSLAALTLLGVGTFAVLNLRKISTLSETIKFLVSDFQKEANEILQSSKKIYTDVSNLSKDDLSKLPKTAVVDVVMKDDKPVRNILRLGKKCIMEEFSNEGNLIRRTIFDGKNVKVHKVSKAAGNGSDKLDEIFSFANGSLTSYEKNCKLMQDGSYSWDKVMIFKDDKPSFCARNIVTLKDTVKKYAKGILFEEGKPFIYTEDFSNLGEHKITCSRCFRMFKNLWREASM